MFAYMVCSLSPSVAWRVPNQCVFLPTWCVTAYPRCGQLGLASALLIGSLINYPFSQRSRPMCVRFHSVFPPNPFSFWP
uniref:Uncharacterized protein n=1 Tax=Picea glauca TaxID=3330 RepID=A0A101M344_PICGL|nr:hypothetical protein ABT39_MTgene19 [Picea glauca]QHR86214.1 hypothetical protein Q903MT_gene213 [Picea sitchensis]